MMFADAVSRADLCHATIAWFQRAARQLPWRGVEADDVSPWAVFISEFMLQQTQAERVIPVFVTWLDRWPRPSALAVEATGEAVRSWGRLGYPRRALWLHKAAVSIANEHDDTVPSDIDILLSLTGVGAYTARAVACFAYAKKHPVVDTNTRRVLARLMHGRAAAAAPRAADLIDMESLLPERAADARSFNAAVMELGATVCTARSPGCADCPVSAWCRWRSSGYPDNAPPVRKQAPFRGSDRQVRGRIMKLLRNSEPGGVSRDAALRAALEGGVRDDAQPIRAYDSLISDGLVVEYEGAVHLP